MTIITNIVSCLLCLLITACASSEYTAYRVTSADLSMETRNLASQFSNTKTIVQLKKANFSKDEWIEVLRIEATIMLLLDKYNKLSNGSYEVSVSDIELFWELVQISHSNITRLTSNKLSYLTPSVGVMLDSFNKSVGENDLEIGKLLSDPSEDNINKALLLISGTMNYSARALSLLAISL